MRGLRHHGRRRSPPRVTPPTRMIVRRIMPCSVGSSRQQIHDTPCERLSSMLPLRKVCCREPRADALEAFLTLTCVIKCWRQLQHWHERLRRRAARSQPKRPGRRFLVRVPAAGTAPRRRRSTRRATTDHHRTRPGRRPDRGQPPGQRHRPDRPRRPATPGQRVHVGIAHAGTTLAVEAAGTTFCVYDADQLITEVAQSTTKAIARFKARKPEPPRRAADRAVAPPARPAQGVAAP